MPNLYKRMSFPSGLKKSVHERSYWSPNGSRSNFQYNWKYGVPVIPERPQGLRL
jgi:hypothetical protein